MQLVANHKHEANIAEPERWASLIAGSALTVIGLTRRSNRGTGLSATLMGAELIRRGITGHSLMYEMLGVRTAGTGQGAETTSVPYESGTRVDRAVTVARPRAEVYRLWRDLENLPRFMRHIESVIQLEDRRSRWVVSAPAGKSVEWDAEIINEIENELIGFRSVGGNVDLAGSVQFKDAPAGRGTELIVEISYVPPAGILGAMAARLWGENPAQLVTEDLQRFKEMVEAGEILTTEGQPSGPLCAEPKVHPRRQRDEVTRASEESFPASDAPSWR